MKYLLYEYAQNKGDNSNFADKNINQKEVIDYLELSLKLFI